MCGAKGEDEEDEMEIDLQSIFLIGCLLFFLRHLAQECSVLQNCKQTWKVINKILKPDKEKHSSSIESILYENNIYNDSDQFANIFNQHFSSVGQKISETFQNLPYDTSSDSI